MAQFVHENFEVDEIVDRLFARRFETLVSDAMDKMSGECMDENLKRQMAVDKVFDAKEEYKSKEKKAAAALKEEEQRQKIEELFAEGYEQLVSDEMERMAVDEEFEDLDVESKRRIAVSQVEEFKKEFKLQQMGTKERKREFPLIKTCLKRQHCMRHKLKCQIPLALIGPLADLGVIL